MAPVSDLHYRELSFWMDTVDDDLSPRDPLGGSVDVDVVIVGAGFTGMWTAYYLKKADPSARVAIVEKDVAGFGASGRNGGWCSALFPTSMSKLARMHDREAAIDMQRAMNDTVDEVGRVLAAEGIDAHYAKGGTLAFARSAPQVARASEEIAEYREFGFGEDHLRWLEGNELDAVAKPTHAIGATYTPDCAAIQPARLARGLARVLDAMGVTIYESSPALRIDPGLVTTEHGAVRAAIVVRATEGFTPSLPGYERALIPIYSLMIATEPLDDDVWDQIGLAQRQTFTDFRHLLIYGQRTADGRMAFGGRGAPYHFGSAIDPSFDREPAVFEELRQVLGELFPPLRKAAITHQWGGPLGVPRDWHASVGFDRASGLAWAGGYVGDGVSTTNLSGRTLADLITGADTELTRLPWVNHHSPDWEPEPLRWLGVNSGLRVMTSADAEEARTGRPSRRAELFGRFTGH
jgi:glycine/D-amino acid oxidase-like deaminating enzyme